MAFSKYLLVEFAALIITVSCAVYVYLKFVAYSYWSSRKVDYVKPVVPVGNIWPIISKQSAIGEFFRDCYLKHRKSKLFGVYMMHKPALMVNDLDLLRIVLTKEFAHFHDRGMYHNEKIDPLSGHIFLLPGARWRFLRSKFSPTFTSSKMKQMFFTVKECSDKLAAFVIKKSKTSEVVEMKDLIARFSTDVIASAAFGIQCNSIDNPDAEFRKWGRKVFSPRPFVQATAAMLPQLLDLLRIAPTEQDVADFFIRVFKETVEYRTANNVERKDFLNLIIQLMNTGSIQDNDEKISGRERSEADNEKITMLEGAAQAYVFWLAGFETSSTTATWCLYELAQNPDIQDRVADEINRVLEEFGDVTYESLKKMPYLHQVLSETMRKYPPVPILNRECTKDFDMPGTGLRVSKGTAMIIPVYGIHMNPDIYPKPEKFDPERFNEEAIASRHPYAHLPFGEGPRNCIGMRFGLVQTKVGLVRLLSKCRFSLGPNLKVPVEVNKNDFVTGPLGGIHLRIEQR